MTERLGRCGDTMANSFEFKRLRRLTTIYYVVQAFMLVLFGASAFWLQVNASSQIFISSLIRAVVVQLILFYPIYKFAAYEARREVSSCRTTLTPDESMALRRKRVTGDIVKSAIFIFFIMFIVRAPQAPGILFPILFVFILTTLCYFQCFNFVARQEMKANQ